MSGSNNNNEFRFYSFHQKNVQPCIQEKQHKPLVHCEQDFSSFQLMTPYFPVSFRGLLYILTSEKTCS